MRVLVALGGNALLRRGQPMTAGNQRANVRIAAERIKEVAVDHQVVVAHGNGPQVGLLALQSTAYQQTHLRTITVGHNNLMVDGVRGSRHLSAGCVGG